VRSVVVAGGAQRLHQRRPLVPALNVHHREREAGRVPRFRRLALDDAANREAVLDEELATVVRPPMVHRHEERHVVRDRHRVLQEPPELAPRRIRDQPIDVPVKVKEVAPAIDLAPLHVAVRLHGLDERAVTGGRLKKTAARLQRGDERPSKRERRHHAIVRRRPAHRLTSESGSSTTASLLEGALTAGPLAEARRSAGASLRALERLPAVLTLH
jgi:hypothetical protein